MPTHVILGGGIIGLACAYYLTEDAPSDTIHLVEVSPALFASASSKAGGFITEDWYAAYSTPLGKLSWQLHNELKDRYGGEEKWGFSPSTAYQLESTKGRDRSENWLMEDGSRADDAKEKREEGLTKEAPQWLMHNGVLRGLSRSDTVAVVNPLQLCQFLLSELQSRGVQLHHPAKATKVLTTDSTITGIQILYTNTQETADLACDNLLLTCGAWTTRVYNTLFPNASHGPKVSSLAGHSIVLKSPKWTEADAPNGCHAVFVTHANGGFHLEIFSKPGGELWLGGLNDPELPFPELATDNQIDEASIKRLVELGKRLCGDDVQVLREALCHRPVSERGSPLITPIDERYLGGVKGKVIVASGHGAWGVSLSMGTGKVVSDMVHGKEKLSANIMFLQSI